MEFLKVLGSGEDARLLVKYTDHPQDSDLVTIGKDLNVEGINPYPHKSIPKLPIGNAGAVFLKSIACLNF